MALILIMIIIGVIIVICIICELIKKRRFVWLFFIWLILFVPLTLILAPDSPPKHTGHHPRLRDLPPEQ